MLEEIEKKKEVVITIRTSQISFQTKEEDSMELVTTGKKYEKNGSTYLIYEESEVSGLKGNTTTIKISGGTVSMVRSGGTSSKMVFEEGRRHKSLYDTEFGKLSMEILTKEVNILKTESSLNARINYDITLKGMFEGKNILEISVN